LALWNVTVNETILFGTQII